MRTIVVNKSGRKKLSSFIIEINEFKFSSFINANEIAAKVAEMKNNINKGIFDNLIII